MNVNVYKEPTYSAYGYHERGSIPSRCLMLHAKGIVVEKSWPPTTFNSGVIRTFRAIPIRPEHVKSCLGTAEVNMNSIKSRRELTDTIPIMQLAKQVLEQNVQGLTSWELLGWAEDKDDSSQEPEQRINITIVVQIQTNKDGDFVFKPASTWFDWDAYTVVRGTGLLLLAWWLFRKYRHRPGSGPNFVPDPISPAWMKELF